MKNDVDLLSILEKELTTFTEPKLEEYGSVVRVFDGIAEIYGLDKVGYYEVVLFESGNKGIILKLDEKIVSAVLLDRNISVLERETVRRTGDILKIGFSPDLIGRVIDSTGTPLDNLPPIQPECLLELDKAASGIVDRGPVNRPFETGILAIDALIPIGKGQRELLVGDRTTGKTSLIIDTILHQKGRNVICIYVSIGNKRSSCAKTIDLFEKAGAMDYTIVIESDANASPILQFLAPYTGCSIGERFMEQGKDVFIAYDDLSNHAIAYRSLSLLLRRPPGREAYPGDIFYVHSRLLERSCQLAPHRGGGSLTAMPVVETLGNDVSAYVPTNLISITDGQIIFDTHRFNQGIKPAIDVGASVSRVGTLAQCPAMKKVQGVLKLDLAQYAELVNFARFGSDLDKSTKFQINRGDIAIELLKQGQFETYACTAQVILLVLLNNGMLDGFSADTAKEFAVQTMSFIQETYPEIYQEIDKTRNITDEQIEKIKQIAMKFFALFRQDD
jgi:F-type H+-transporting ATPase subunit alpha